MKDPPDAGLIEERAGPATFTYDAKGNLTSDGTTTFAYSSENRLTSTSGGITGGITVAVH
jgi:hypothetical protein